MAFQCNGNQMEKDIVCLLVAGNQRQTKKGSGDHGWEQRKWKESGREGRIEESWEWSKNRGGMKGDSGYDHSTYFTV